MYFSRNQCSVQESGVAGAKQGCLKGGNVLSADDLLNNRPDCTSIYCASVADDNFSHIIPCRERPQIQIFLLAFSSCAAYRPMPKPSRCQYAPKKSVYRPNT